MTASAIELATFASRSAHCCGTTLPLLTSHVLSPVNAVEVESLLLCGGSIFLRGATSFRAWHVTFEANRVDHWANELSLFDRGGGAVCAVWPQVAESLAAREFQLSDCGALASVELARAADRPFIAVQPLDSHRVILAYDHRSVHQ